MDIEAMRPWSYSLSEPTAVRLGSDSDDWSLHTAGPDSPGRATRLHVLVTAAIGSGPGRSRRSGAGQSGMERVDGGDFSEPGRAGPGPRCGVIGKYRFTVTPYNPLETHTVSTLPFKAVETSGESLQS